jgi:hypothetical protein
MHKVLSAVCLTSACSAAPPVSVSRLITSNRGSQWPRGLRHEQSSLARTLGSWFRIPPEAWMSVFILCVGRGLAMG